MSSRQWPAFLIGPPLTGTVADLIGLQVALVTLVAAAALIILLSTWIRSSPASEQPVRRSVAG